MKYALMILQLFPAIIAAIKSLEEFLPVDGAGKEKLDIIKKTLEIADSTSKEIWPMLEKIIGLLVSAANTLGIFKKKDNTVA